jgi:hypothetical protein
LRISKDLVGELRRDVAAEGRADQLALLNFLGELLRRELPAGRAHAQQRVHSHQEFLAPDRMGQEVIDSSLECGHALLRRLRDRQQRQQQRRRIGLEQTADHGEGRRVLLGVDDEQVRRAAGNARQRADPASRHRR